IKALSANAIITAGPAILKAEESSTKMPAPIVEPIPSMIASNKDNLFLNSRSAITLTIIEFINHNLKNFTKFFQQ
ncbi:MAG: hypothetical protein ACTSQW_01355, partial [Promethearchaeota archaeon]